MVKKDIKNKTKRKKKSLPPFVDRFPYIFSPNFIHHKGKVQTILQLFVREGSNRQIGYGDMVDVIPTPQDPAVKSFFIQDDVVIKDEEKDSTVRKNSKNVKKTLKHQQEEKKQGENKTEGDKKIDREIVGDFDDYELVLNTAEPIVGFNIKVAFVGNDEQAIANQIENVNRRYNQKHDGMRLDSFAGRQDVVYTELFKDYEPSWKEFSSTGKQYTGLSVATSNGLTDPHGIPIGRQIMSVTASSELFDFETHTKGMAFIAIPKKPVMVQYPKSPPASVVSQAAANWISMHGSRVHHIILNDFNYLANELDKNFITPMETDKIFDYFDMSKQTVNILQGFGNQEDASKVFARLKAKVYDVFDILSHYALSKDKNTRSIILDTLNAFYETQQLWDEKVANNTGRAGILNVENNEEYPTATDFLNEFTNMATKFESMESRMNTVLNLKTQLEDAMTTYSKQVNRTTNIPESKSKQVFYDFGKMVSDKTLQAVQLINTLDFILYQTEPNDLIVIHGMDNLLDRVTQMMKESLDFYLKQGRRFIFSFDTISGTDTADGNTASVFTQQGRLYKDLSMEADWSMFGQVLPSEIEDFKKAMHVEFSNATITTLQKTPNKARALVHRRQDDVNDFVELNVQI